MRAWIALSLGGSLALLTGCNVFSVVDSPSGNAQDLSKARACFDQGDLPCAQQYYAKVSGSEQDQALSEDSFTYLDQEGAGMGNFMAFVGDISSSGTGVALTNFAQKLLAVSSASSRRSTIFNAFAMASQIQDPNLAGFTRFIAGTALVTELLAEESSDGAHLLKSDIVSDPTGCISATGAAILTGTACNAGTSNFGNFETTMTLTSAFTTANSPSLDDTFNALGFTVAALTSLGANGKFSNAVNVFTKVTTLTVPDASCQARPSGGFNPGDGTDTHDCNLGLGRAFRNLLVTQGIGG